MYWVVGCTTQNLKKKNNKKQEKAQRTKNKTYHSQYNGKYQKSNHDQNTTMQAACGNGR